MKIELINKDAQWPTIYPQVAHQAPTVQNKGWDRVGDFTLRDKTDFMPQVGLQEKLCSCESNLIFLAGAASMGKGMALDAPILTPNGFMPLGELHEGDIISGASGSYQTIDKIYEQGIKKMYLFTMADGTSIESSSDHLWPVTLTFHKKGSIQTFLTTDEIIEHWTNRKRKVGLLRNIKFKINGAIEFSYRDDLPIDPYVLGLLIGNACLMQHRIQYSTSDISTLEELKSKGYVVHHCSKYDYLITGNNLYERIESLGLGGHSALDKFIPKRYLFCSIDDRRSLLQGLMDTNGSCGKQGGIVEFSTSSKQLSEDFCFLARSLGYKVRCVDRIPTYTYKGETKVGATSYRIRLSSENLSNVFRLERKRNNIRPYHKGISYDSSHYLSSITYTGEKECRCILVSNEDHLFIGKDFIVTHNTYCMLLNALRGIDKPGYTARFISVRLQDSKKGSSIFRDGVEILGNYAGCQYNASDYPTFVWNKWNSNLQMIHSNFNAENPSEWELFKDYAKKNQASYIAIDEATEIRSFKMFSYWFSRNRDSSGMKPQMVLSFNPEHEHWTTKMMQDAGYLTEEWYVKPEMNGRTKYFYIQGDNPEGIIWGDTPEDVASRAHISISAKEAEAGVTIHQIIKSFTFFTGEAGDNKKLIAATGGENIGNLHAVGGTQRAILHGAYFGPVDDEQTTVSRQMIRNMFTNPTDDNEDMYGTLDVSMGTKESDNCPFVIWRGLNIIAIKMIKADPKELVSQIDAILEEYNIPISNFAFDSTGAGYYLTAYTAGVPITANRRTIPEYDKDGNQVVLEQYFNLRSQLMGKMKVLFEKGLISCILSDQTMLPYGKKGQMRNIIDILFDEINVFRTSSRNKRIYYRSKEEYKAKFHSSPDLMDSIVLRAVFELDARPKKKAEPDIEEDAYDALYESYAHNAGVVWI